MTAPGARDLLTRFWRELTDLRTGMLGLTRWDDAHAQPMTAHFDGEKGPLWFYARRDGDLARGALDPGPAVFHYTGRGHDLYACLHGELQVTDDAQARARYWTEDVARWFPGGQDDPDLAMLRLTPSRVQIWLPRDSQAPTPFDLDGEPADVRGQVRL